MLWLNSGCTFALHFITSSDQIPAHSAWRRNASYLTLKVLVVMLLMVSHTGSRCRPTVFAGGNASLSPARWAPTRGRVCWILVFVECLSERYSVSRLQTSDTHNTVGSTWCFAVVSGRGSMLPSFFFTRLKEDHHTHCSSSNLLLHLNIWTAIHSNLWTAISTVSFKLTLFNKVTRVGFVI